MALPRFRNDIEWVLYPDNEKWVARDPLSSSFYYFSEVEFAATKLLDGKNSLNDVVRILNQNFPNQEIDENWFKVLNGKLRASNLILLSNPFRNRHQTQSIGEALRLFCTHVLLSPLSIRLPIVRPTHFSPFFLLLAKVLFHPFTAICTFIAATICCFLVVNEVLGHPNSLLYDFRKIQGDRWIAILASYLIVKSLHEMGHVLACARWGAHCKEIGILFLFFTPCLYCDTTDCWKLPSRWQRAAVGAAGIYVEIIIACFASMVWLTANDGLERIVAASIMLMCSLSTIIVNGNPFFRYDGYYILSDMWGVPNLAQQSSTALWRVFVYCLGGRKWRSNEFEASALTLACFALLSSIYRWFVLILVMWLVWNTLVPMGMGFLALLILATTGVGILIGNFRFWSALFAEFFAPMPVKVLRFSILIATLAASVYMATTIPIPGFVRARGYLDFKDKVPIYAPETAAMQFVSKKMGTSDPSFKAGERMFEMNCPEKKYELMNLLNEISYTNVRIDILKRSSVNERSTSFELPPLLEVAKDLEAKRELLAPEVESLTRIASKDGFLILSPARTAPPLTSPVDIRSVRSPLHPDSMACTIEKGTLLGWYSSKEQVLIQALVSETEIQSLRIDNPVSCILDSNLSIPIRCQIVRISPDPVMEMPHELLGDSSIITMRNSKGLFEPEKPHYLVTLVAESEVPLKIKGLTGTVVFRLPSKTLFEQFVRYVRLTFKPIQ